MSCCFLDEEKFRVCCRLLLQHSNSIRDGWTWEEGQDPGEDYLRKSTLGRGRGSAVSNQEQLRASAGPDQRIPNLTTDHQQDSGQDQVSFPVVDFDDGIADDDDDDEGCFVSEGSGQVVQYEYHILYSCSYQTPVLYFRASTLEGRSLSLEEVWNTVHPNYRLRLQHSPWDSITQQEHPLLGQPFFWLHPCRTEEFMGPVMKAALEEHRQVNYVVTWLSVVGPAVGLDVPLSYSTQACGPPPPPGAGGQPD